MSTSMFTAVDAPTAPALVAVPGDENSLAMAVGADESLEGPALVQIDDEILAVAGTSSVHRQATLTEGMSTATTALPVSGHFLFADGDVVRFWTSTDPLSGDSGETATVTSITPSTATVQLPVSFNVPPAGEAIYYMHSDQKVHTLRVRDTTESSVTIGAAYTYWNAGQVGTAGQFSDSSTGPFEAIDIISVTDTPLVTVSRTNPVAHVAGEIVRVESLSEYWSVTRGQSGTAVTTHEAGALVQRLYRTSDFASRFVVKHRPVDVALRLNASAENSLGDQVGQSTVPWVEWTQTSGTRRSTAVFHVVAQAGDVLTMAVGQGGPAAYGGIEVQTAADATGAPVARNYFYVDGPVTTQNVTYPAIYESAAFTYSDPATVALRVATAGYNAGRGIEFLTAGHFTVGVYVNLNP